jgi:adenosylhomocysteine nucleosidase
MIVVLSEDIMGISALLSRGEILENESVNGINIYKVRFENTLPFMVVISGYGKVNTARAIQYVDTKYCIDKLIVTGNTGSLEATTAALGTVGISTNAFQYDVDFTALGVDQYEFPNQTVYQYVANQDLITKAQTAALVAAKTTTTGIYATADSFLADDTEATALRTNTDALFVDTNTADAAQVAYFNEIPYVAIKGISNYAGANAVTEYNTNVTEANTNANEVVYQLLMALLAIRTETAQPRCQANGQTINWNGCCNPNPCDIWRRIFFG